MESFREKVRETYHQDKSIYPFRLEIWFLQIWYVINTPNIPRKGLEFIISDL